MTTPKREQILQLARELYFNDMAKSGINNFNDPEPNELAESGYVQTARSMLMRSEDSEYKNHIEQEARELGLLKDKKENLENSESFSVNVEQLFESNALILGSRHSGKSDVGMLIADKCMEKGSIVVCFDPSQDWIARSSIPQYETLTIPFIAAIPIKSIVYDISLLSPIESQKVVESFSEKLFRQQAETSDRKKYLIVFEESHTYFPQGCMRAKAYQKTVKLLSVGRNVDISCLLISQFASMLDKFAIKHSINQTYLGFTKEFNDLKYLRSLLGSNVEQLTKLSDGEFLYLTRDNLQKIAITPYQSGIAKTQILPNIPQAAEPLEEKIPKRTNTVFNLLNLAVVAFFAILLLSSMPK